MSDNFLYQDDIDDIVSASPHSDELYEIISNHFADLDRPCSVSLGCGKYSEFSQHKASHIDFYRKELIASVLQNAGIDAVTSDSPHAAEIDRVIVEPTGIRTPFMSPGDALKLTTKIFDTLKENDISVVGFALPLTNDNLCKSSNRTYDGILDLSTASLEKELDVNQGAAKMLPERGVTFDEFINQQLEKTDELPAIDLDEEMRQNFRDGMPFLWRGATLGNQPYGVIADRRNKDVVFATADTKLANVYSGGYKVSSGQYENKGYGFIYKYKTHKDQKYYKNYGIEGREEAPQFDTYETPVFPHKNPLAGIYLNFNNKIIPITDEYGKFISKEWEDFMLLHEPHVQTNNDYEKQRITAQKEQLLKGTSISLEQITTSKTLDLSHRGSDIRGPFELRGKDFSKFDTLIAPEYVKNDCYGTKWPKNVDFSKCKSVHLTGADFSNIETFTPPMGTIFTFRNIKWPASMKNLDLSSTYEANLAGADLSNFESIEFPKRISWLTDTKFPKSMKVFDFSKSEFANFEYANLSNAEVIKLPQSFQYFNEAKLPETLKELDCSQCKRLDLGSVNLSGIENIKWPENGTVSFNNNTKYPPVLDFSECKGEIFFPDNADLSKVNIIMPKDKDTKVNFGENTKLSEEQEKALKNRENQLSPSVAEKVQALRNKIASKSFIRREEKVSNIDVNVLRYLQNKRQNG